MLGHTRAPRPAHSPRRKRCSDIFAPRAALYAAYRAECEQSDSRPVSAITFGRAVRKAFPDVGVKHTHQTGIQLWYWEGIRMLDATTQTELILDVDGSPDTDEPLA